MKETNDIINKLSEQGYRLTPQRMMVLDAIEKSDHHISAEEIYAQVIARYPHLNISTVYRTLELLHRLGLVTETDLGGGRVRYHPADKGHHHHLVCQECGKVIDLDESVMDNLKEMLKRDYDFAPDIRHLALFGICADCRK
ncbi:MAG: Fur family transcriptional regulator [Dehalococcoidia bacterium SG8_51_3]|nr:MAG: Fur family transcriptional regulator [Dehalococcoidia bacterium SG8_51_3]